MKIKLALAAVLCFLAAAAVPANAEGIEPAAADISDTAVVESIPEQVYDGTAKQPEVSVYYEDARLTAGEDYTVSYENNVNAGTADAVIAFCGAYEGSVTAHFGIARAVYDMSGVAFEGQSVPHDGEVHELAVSGELPEGVTVSYDGNAQTGPGRYTVTAHFTGDGVNYEPIEDMTAELLITADDNCWTRDLTCADIVFGRLPEPSAEALYGDVVYTYSADENGPFTAEAPSAVGRCYVRAAVDGDGIFNDLTADASFRVLFSDVTDPAEFWYGPTYWAADLGITRGWTDGTFRPMNICNRAAVVAFLWRLEGCPEPQAMASFSDMTGYSDFDRAISWASENGIVTGWPDNTFRPWNACSRAAIAAFLWRYAGAPEYTVPDAAPFMDLTGNGDFDQAMLWAEELGIASGWNDATFRPWNKCNRLSVITFLYRFAEPEARIDNDQGQGVLDTPVFSLSATKNGIKVEWGAVSGASVYRVYYRTPGGVWNPASAVSGTSAEVTGLRSGREYEFTVRAFGDGRDNSLYTVSSRVWLACPAVTAVNVSSGIKVSWGSVAGASSYQVSYRVSGGSWSTAQTVTGTATTITGLTSGKTYEIRVRAVGTGGVYSVYMSQSRKWLARPSVTLTNETTQMKVSWNAVAGASSYQVSYRVSGGSWSTARTVTGTGTAITGLTRGRTYEVRVRAVGSGGTYSAYGTDKKEWRPTPTATARVCQYPDRYAIDYGDVGMFYVIKTSDNKVIVVDGGNTGNADYARQVIASFGNHVDAWIITHQHCDHVGAFNEIYSDPRGIVIDHIYSNYVPSSVWRNTPGNKPDPRDIPEHDRFDRLMSGANNITWLHAGDEIYIGGMIIRVYAAYDSALTPYYGNDIGNVSSLMFEIFSKNQSMLFCGDVRTETMCNYLINKWGNELRADYLQISHHGNSSLSRAFIKKVSASVVFFDCPEWLYNSAKHDAAANWAYCRSLGATCYRWASGTPNTVNLS